MKVLIVGHGTVGTNLERDISALSPDVRDKYKTSPADNTYEQGESYDFAFICVDTPMTSAACCDVGEVENAVLENEAGVYVIKSTVYPGFTEALSEKTGKQIVFSPEYYGGTQHCNNFDFPYTILGGQREACLKVAQLLQHVHDARHSFHFTSSTTAELAKYMENSYLATKVSFCVQFYRLAERYGIAYEELRELFILDPRVNPAHTYVYEDHPYWSSHCLDKDVRTIAEHGDADFIKSMIAYNERCKEATGDGR